MIYISHRGNIYGKNVKTENTEQQIINCINLHFLVEIDLWYMNNSFFLGHDAPLNKISTKFLLDNKRSLWCHAKNEMALFELMNYNLHCFWHEEDKYTITSKGFIWAYPNSLLHKNTIAVLPEISKYSIENLLQSFGICSDNIQYYKELIRS
jgi:hypothetical protein